MLTLFLLHLASAASGKCRVLCIGGGSDKAAYTAGAVIGLMQALPTGEAEYNVVTGNGDGSFNAYLIAQTSPSDLESAISSLNDFWTKFSYSQFYQDWIGGIAAGVFFQSGLFDSYPLKQTIQSLNKGSFQRFMSVGATDLLSSAYVVFNTSLPVSALLQGVFASSSRASIFPYVQYGEYKLVDGSLKFTIDILTGIDACNNMGYTDSQIVVDAIISDGRKISVQDPADNNAIQNALRYLEIESYAQTNLVVTNAKHDHPEIDLRTFIFPNASFPFSEYPFDYSKLQLQNMINLGIEDAKAAVQKIQVTTK